MSIADMFNQSKAYSRLAEKVFILEKISGLSIEVLTQMFLAGFEMRLPDDYLDKAKRMEELAEKFRKIEIDELRRKTAELKLQQETDEAIRKLVTVKGDEP